MSKEGDLIFELINIWAGEQELYSKQGTIKSIDVSERTCIVAPVDGGPDILDVYLEADAGSSDEKGFFVAPAVGSLVIVTWTSNEEAFLSAYTQIDKVIAKQGEWIFNDGGNGGVIKINEQVKKLNGLVKELQQELIKISTGISSAGGAYTPGTISQFTRSDFENELVKH